MAGWCQGCGADLGVRSGDVVGRTATCEGCGVDLHACVQCDHYDPKAHNECREPQAERVDDRRRANFCDYFRLRATRPDRAGAVKDRASEARARLDALFRKPGGSG